MNKSINEANKIAYRKRKKEGYVTIGLIVPVDKRDELVVKARQQGLSLAAYCRGVLCGEECRNLDGLREREYVR